VFLFIINGGQKIRMDTCMAVLFVFDGRGKRKLTSTAKSFEKENSKMLVSEAIVDGVLNSEQIAANVSLRMK